MRIAARLCGLILLFAIAWSAAWAYAAHRAGQALDAFTADERAQGRDWRCPERAIGGFPTSITVTCRNASFAGQSFGTRVLGTVSRLRASVTIGHPRTAVLRLEAPFSYTDTDGRAKVAGSWSSLDVDLVGLPYLDGVTLSGVGLEMKGRFGQAGDGAGTVRAFDATFTRLSGGSDPVLGFTVAAQGLALPALDPFFGDAKPVSVTLAGTLNHADVTGADTPEAALAIWQRSGGRVDLAPSRMTRGAARMVASGTLRLDSEHRLQGHLDADFYGLEPVLARYGIGGNVAAAGSLLSTLFGGGRKAPPPSPGALSLPISFNNGRIGIGPIRTDVVLGPLY